MHEGDSVAQVVLPIAYICNDGYHALGCIVTGNFDSRCFLQILHNFYYLLSA